MVGYGYTLKKTITAILIGCSSAWMRRLEILFAKITVNLSSEVPRHVWQCVDHGWLNVIGNNSYCAIMLAYRTVCVILIEYENTHRPDRFWKSAMPAGTRQEFVNCPNQTSSFNQVVYNSSKAQRLTRELMSAHCFDEAQSGKVKLLGE
jgi:hypothetical protein